MRSPRRLLAALPLLALAAAAPRTAAAQDILPDARIRITAPALSPHRAVGTYAGMRGDTLLARLGGDTAVVALPTPSLARVEVSRGAHTRRLRGALLGAGIGGVVTLAALAVAESHSEYDDPMGIFVFLVVPPAAIGGGALIGAATARRAEVWQAVPLPGVGLVPGAPVRVWASAPGLSGPDARVQELRGDTLYLRVDGRSVAVRTADVTRLEVRQGRASRGMGARRGAIRGAVVGGVLGVAGGAVAFRGDDAYVRSTVVGQGAMLGVGLGATFGALVGAVHPGTTWTPSRLPVRVTVGRTRGGGTKLGANLRF